MTHLCSWWSFLIFSLTIRLAKWIYISWIWYLKYDTLLYNLFPERQGWGAGPKFITPCVDVHAPHEDVFTPSEESSTADWLETSKLSIPLSEPGWCKAASEGQGDAVVRLQQRLKKLMCVKYALSSWLQTLTVKSGICLSPKALFVISPWRFWTIRWLQKSSIWMQNLAHASFSSNLVLVSNHKSHLPLPSWGVLVSVVGGWSMEGRGVA